MGTLGTHPSLQAPKWESLQNVFLKVLNILFFKFQLLFQKGYVTLIHVDMLLEILHIWCAKTSISIWIIHIWFTFGGLLYPQPALMGPTAHSLILLVHVYNVQLTLIQVQKLLRFVLAMQDSSELNKKTRVPTALVSQNN